MRNFEPYRYLKYSKFGLAYQLGGVALKFLLRGGRGWGLRMYLSFAVIPLFHYNSGAGGRRAGGPVM